VNGRQREERVNHRREPKKKHWARRKNLLRQIAETRNHERTLHRVKKMTQLEGKKQRGINGKEKDVTAN